jgi:myo-inositol-1(or 4)-monophosphatase
MSSTTETAQLTDFMLKLADTAGSAILPFFRNPLHIEDKGGAGWDPVTEGDKTAEKTIRALIEEHYPTHGIIGEEFGTVKAKSSYSWVLDPIDGTRAFVIGLPVWTTLIGLYRDGQPLLGLMHQPFVGETFVGTPEGSFHLRNGQKTPIKVAASKPLNATMAGTTSPHLYKNPEAFDRLRHAVRLMRYGGDAYFFSLMAAGHLDLALDAGLQIYDIAALIPIIKGAGGVVDTWDGKDPAQGGNIISASNQRLLEEAKALLQD